MREKLLSFSCLYPPIDFSGRTRPPDVCDISTSKINGTKKALYRAAKRLRTKCAPITELRYDQSLVIRKITFPVPADGRFPGLRHMTLSPSRFLSDC